MTNALVNTIYAATGALLPTGTKLLDLKVDLSDTLAQDCPPVSYYRLVLREPAWLRRWIVKAGDEPNVGDVLAILSTAADEAVEAQPHRAVRVMTAGIVPDLQSSSWSGEGK